MNESFPLLSLLGIVFIVLRLTGVVAWSWWWVLCPFWLIPAIIAAFIALLAVMFFLAAVFGD
jgi:hypothetical protein